MKTNEFESSLRSMLPSGPNSDSKAVFYDCGWKACEASLATKVSPSNRTNNLPFTIGLGAGCVLTAAILMLVQPRLSDRDQRPEAIGQAPAASSAEISTPLPDRVDRNNNEQSESISLSDTIRLWKIDDLFAADDLALLTESPLSNVAQQSWKKQITASVQWSGGSGSTFSDSRHVRRSVGLTVGTVDQDLIDDLLL